MADETETLIITQPEAKNFRHEGALSHSTAEGKPLVHMVLWDDDCPCTVEGRVVLAGDPQAPFAHQVEHRFPDGHQQDHRLHTALDRPLHHALQMRTPLQVRFCNTWHIASDYTVEVALAGRSFASIRLTGATVARPQPCDEPCPALTVLQPIHP